MSKFKKEDEVGFVVGCKWFKTLRVLNHLQPKVWPCGCI